MFSYFPLAFVSYYPTWSLGYLFCPVRGYNNFPSFPGSTTSNGFLWFVHILKISSNTSVRINYSKERFKISFRKSRRAGLVAKLNRQPNRLFPSFTNFIHLITITFGDECENSTIRRIDLTVENTIAKSYKIQQ